MAEEQISCFIGQVTKKCSQYLIVKTDQPRIFHSSAFYTTYFVILFDYRSDIFWNLEHIRLEVLLKWVFYLLTLSVLGISTLCN